jgi:hypothetical protein
MDVVVESVRFLSIEGLPCSECAIPSVEWEKVEEQ